MPERFHTRLHNYVLMDNHYHLVMETGEANLSLGLQWLNGGYSQAFNKRHHRSGHLLEGRFKAIIVEPQRWGLELSRYVHLNPVRVGRFALDKGTQSRNRRGTGIEHGSDLWQARINYLREYPWSSYRAYIGLEPSPDWLVCETVLSWMRGSEEDPRTAYQRYVEEAVREGIRQTPWDQLAAQVVLGSQEFVDSLRDRVRGNEREQRELLGLAQRPDFLQVIGAVERWKGERWQAFVNRHGDWGRDLALSLAYEYCGLTLQQLGALVDGLDYVSVSGAVRRFRQRIERDPTLAQAFQQISCQLKNK